MRSKNVLVQDQKRKQRVAYAPSRVRAAKARTPNLVKYQRILGHPVPRRDTPNLVKHQRILGIPKSLSSAPDALTSAPDALTSAPDVLSSAPDVLSSAPDVLSSAPDVMTKNRRSQLSFGGEARTAALHLESLRRVVRRLRTTHRKFLRSDSTVCAFAPPEKRLASKRLA